MNRNRKEKTASSCAGESLGWKLGKIPPLEGLSSPGTVQGRVECPSLEGFNPGDVALGDMGQRRPWQHWWSRDSMGLGGFSNLKDCPGRSSPGCLGCWEQLGADQTSKKPGTIPDLQLVDLNTQNGQGGEFLSSQRNSRPGTEGGTWREEDLGME